MQKIYKILLRSCICLLIFGGIFLILSNSQATSNPYDEKGIDIKGGFKKKNLLDMNPKDVKSVQVEADQVQFSQDSNKATASGNVVITANTTTLHADKLELERAIGEAVASG
ncbi:MAG: LptA/OstA family protein, partial [Candidatus Omnitrophota bacterium]